MLIHILEIWDIIITLLKIKTDFKLLPEIYYIVISSVNILHSPMNPFHRHRPIKERIELNNSKLLLIFTISGSPYYHNS